MNLKDYILQNVDYKDYYKSRFKDWDHRSNNNVTCPFHDDRHPSLSVGLSGGGAKCWAASCTAGPWGNIIHFEAALNHGGDEQAAAESLYTEFVRPIIPDEELATLQRNLASDAAYQRWLSDDCGLDRDACRGFGLGLDTRKGRVAIPVYDRWGHLVNVRLYKLPRHRTDADESRKIINYAKGYGKLDLFPWQHFIRYELDRPLFVMASEKEAMLAIAHGLQAICSTNGETSWSEEWSELLGGFHVGIVQQNDEAGEKAAAKRLEKIEPYASSCIVVKIATLQKDFADWVVKDKGSGLKLLAAYNKSVPSVVDMPSAVRKNPKSPSSVGATSPELPAYYSQDLMELAHVGTRPDMLNKIIRCQGIVAAKATHTYTVPWKFVVKPKNAPAKTVAVKMGRELISFVGMSDAGIRDTVRSIYDDDKLSVSFDDFVTIVEVEVIPTATVDRDVPYVVQRCYYVGRWIDANVPYELEIIPTTEMKTQKTVGILVRAVPISHSFEKLEFSDEDFATLQIFRPEENQSVENKLEQFADELAKYYTKIYNRPEWHIAAMLTWTSPIGWRFPHDTKVTRGWLSTLALGDTRTGKSQVTETIQSLTKSGQFVNSENCTYVGLVGGAIKMGSGQLMLRWGRIPLCDKQLVVLEELSGLPVEHISHMSDVRSSGIARLDKGGIAGETNARTRMLALSNVRSKDKTLAAYTSGVKAVQELIGYGEDIARFDLILTLIDSDVSLEVINAPVRRVKGAKAVFKPADLQRLVQFCWALKPEQIQFSTEAYFSCLDLTIELSKEYHPAVPIFKGAEGRYKLARIAASIATLQFSWDMETQKIIVNEEHVAAAASLLRRTYNKRPLCYNEWSKQMFDREDISSLEELNTFMDRHFSDIFKRVKIIDSVIHAGKFSRDELCAICSISMLVADAMLGVFLRNRVIRKGEANTWELTPPGKRWLQTLETSNTPQNAANTNGSDSRETDSGKPTLRSLIRKR